MYRGRHVLSSDRLDPEASGPTSSGMDTRSASEPIGAAWRQAPWNGARARWNQDRLAGRFPLGLDAGVASPPVVAQQQAVKTVTLTFLGDFPNPWKNNPALERQRLQQGRWAPSTDDLTAVANADQAAAGTIHTTPCFEDLLKVIEGSQDKSIARVNIISHGSPNGLGLLGTINASNGQVTFRNKPSCTGYVDVEAIKDNKSRILKLRVKFAPKARMFLYLCNSGANLTLLQRLADAFDLRIRGFLHQIYYCVTHRGNQLDRGWTRYNRDGARPPRASTCQAGGYEKGFDHLQTDTSFPITYDDIQLPRP